METVQVPLLVLDDHMVVLSANPAFLSAFELQPDGVVGHSLFDIPIGRWDKDRLHEHLLTVLPTRTEISSLELRIGTDGLGTRVFLLNARQVRLGGEGQNLILLSMEDRTVQEELQAQVQRHLTQVERSNRDLQEFAHSASHDLQEPLRKIRTYAQRLADRLPPEAVGETERTYLVRMGEATERMQQRIDDILSLGRLGRTPPAMEPVQLVPLLGAVIDDLEPTMEGASARAEIGPLPDILGDPAQLRLLFQNLISNAVKFRRADVPPRIEIVASGTATEVRITVRDNGIGFAPHYAERIFRPFERLHGRESYEGTGIGLSICRRIMENHGGSIEATATPGAGADFTLAFPPASNPANP